jgi:oxalate decarboxylase/phosphoglucose isomerase-like protein (cupin superfamily)
MPDETADRAPGGWKHIELDDPSMWPRDRVVDLPPGHRDDRGAIQPLVDFPVKNVSLITSRSGTVRSNHYHLTDWHFMYVLRGSFEYLFRPAGSVGTPGRVVVREGQMLFTPPMEEHATIFLDDTTLVVASRHVRDQDVYEADVRRVVLVDPTRPR